MSKIYILVGPSGSGKTTLANSLMQYGLHSLVSHTTRPIRIGEKEDVDYHFVSEEEFSQLSFVETAEYAGCHYGMSEKEIDKALRRTVASVAVMEITGAMKMRELFPDYVRLVFILADYDVVQQRMVDRGDTSEDILRRISNIYETGELDNWRYCDYALKSTTPEAGVNQILAIVDFGNIQSRIA